jgi:iron-sulfur cluster insertion protein
VNITITAKAADKIFELVASENNPDIKLRVYIQGGGCSGFMYGFKFDKKSRADDLIFEGVTAKQQMVKVVVDPLSLQYLQGAIVDYKADIYGNNFVITNPNATTTCGCGSSFNV